MKEFKGFDKVLYSLLSKRTGIAYEKILENKLGPTKLSIEEALLFNEELNKLQSELQETLK